MRRLLLALVLAAAATQASAFDADFDISCGDPTTCQRDFHSIAGDITAALNYKALGPAEATGITGIGIAAIATYVETDDAGAWRRLTGEDVDAVGMVGAVVRKGLPFGLDVGAYYATVPGADADLYGGELRWAILEGGTAEPALAVRGTYTQSTGIDDLDYQAYGLDVSVSKGFAFLTPYAGYGYVWSELDPKVAGLDKEEIDASRFFVGLRFGLLIFDITPEYEHIDGRDSFSLLLGASF
ncbi:hypothetical protein D0B54_14775 [Solimonas sp. K1W22B-7]|uniref:hypothetical protein n=1 Tax=Solimonas sp. K1W22B-7 TaxID=2303331 RepID=UPI000E330099|nr:hypothetical protein [Solimonas sp. K1W22B-7]AXQ29862.1 hypothetical protein D0B54_14775 [Solimonas sp. K1W22B-7]